jgi:hypothetical protein
MSKESTRIVLGVNITHGVENPPLADVDISQTWAHMISDGASQSGKSYEGVFLIKQKIDCGEPVFVIDPHGTVFDLLFALLIEDGTLLDPELRKKYLFFDLSYAAERGLYPSLNFWGLESPTHILANNLVEVIHRVWPKTDETPIIDNNLSGGSKVLIPHKLPPTMIGELLTSAPTRQALLNGIEDQEAISFFKDYFEPLQKRNPDIAGSTLRRLKWLNGSPELRYSLENTGSPNLVDFPKFYAEGTSVFVKTHSVSSSITKLTGTLVMVAIEQGALSLVKIPKKLKRRYTVFVDEAWSLMSTDDQSRDTLLQQTTKAWIYLWLCCQNLNKIPLSDRGSLDNCKFRMAFQLGRADAEYLAPYFFQFDPLLVKDMRNAGLNVDSQVSFYSDRDQWGTYTGKLMNLGERTLWAKLPNGDICKLYTLDLDYPEIDEETLQEVRDYYLSTLYKPQAVIEREMADRREKAGLPREKLTSQSPPTQQSNNAPEPQEPPKKNTVTPQEPKEEKPRPPKRPNGTIDNHAQPAPDKPGSPPPQDDDDEDESFLWEPARR